MNDNILAISICLLFLGLVLIGLFLSRNNKTKKWYLAVFLCTIAYLVFSLFSELVEGKEELSGFAFIINLLGFLAIDSIVITFTNYIVSLMNNKWTRTTNVLYSLIMITELSRIICILVFAFTGSLFSIEAGYYVDSDNTYIPYGMTILAMAEAIVLITINRNKFTRRQLIVSLLYFVFPILGTFGEMIVNIKYEEANVYYLTSLGLTLAVSLIYILIQDTKIQDDKVKQKMLEDISKTDFLTGLNNRRAYYESISSLKSSDLVGVIFCDLNGLKYKNDHYGHAAGDELIMDFAKILTENYGNINTYRTSGDEFLVIVKNVSEEEFNVQFDYFYQVIESKKHIAALGKSFGSADCIEKLVTEAESEMYIDKEVYGSRRK